MFRDMEVFNETVCTEFHEYVLSNVYIFIVSS
jgi:hypothetical protein